MATATFRGVQGATQAMLSIRIASGSQAAKLELRPALQYSELRKI